MKPFSSVVRVVTKHFSPVIRVVPKMLRPSLDLSRKCFARHCEEGFSPTKQSKTCANCGSLRRFAPRNDEAVRFRYNSNDRAVRFRDRSNDEAVQFRYNSNDEAVRFRYNSNNERNDFNTTSNFNQLNHFLSKLTQCLLLYP